jgi:hypothetical protein
MICTTANHVAEGALQEQGTLRAADNWDDSLFYPTRNDMGLRQIVRFRLSVLSVKMGDLGGGIF